MARKLVYLATVLLLGTPVFAVVPGVISGYVKNGSGEPQTGALVKVFTSAATMGTLAFTDPQGHYSVENLAPGAYQVKVTANSLYYLPSLRENVNLRAGAHVLVNLTLSTLSDALKLLPPRRSGNSADDDWHWTLRSAANRPILRVFDDDLPVVVSSGREAAGQPLKARVAFLAGSEADGLGAAGETTAFTLEKSLLDSSLALNGNIGASSYGGEPAGVLRASYAHDFGDLSQPRVALTYHHFVAPSFTASSVAGQNAAYSSLGLTTSDTLSIAGFIDLNYGADIQAMEFVRRVGAFRPFGAVDVHLSPDMVAEYSYATAAPNADAGEDFVTSPAGLSGSGGPRMALENGLPRLERARHQEISLARRFGANNLQVAYFMDQVHDIVLTGAGDPSGYSNSVLSDIYSGTFSYNGGGLSGGGTRVVYQRKFSDDLTAIMDYSYGEVVDLKSAVSTWQDVARTLATGRRHSLGAKFSGLIPGPGTRWVASYKWTSGNALSQVDEFNASPGQIDSYLSLLFRQPLPGRSFMPGKMEALVDIRNLLAQGYSPVRGQDGHTVDLVQAPRCVRGGLSFTF